jgi:hypothetical protein
MKKRDPNMCLLNYAAAGVIAVSMMGASSAIAAQPIRAATALPANATVPVNGLRTATPLKHASRQSDGGSPAIGYVMAAVVGAGIIAATIAATDDDSSTPASPG